jgi:hypothetical protein
LLSQPLNFRENYSSRQLSEQRQWGSLLCSSKGRNPFVKGREGERVEVVS